MSARADLLKPTTTPWLAEAEGRLSVDVIETEREMIIRTVMAGVKAEDVDVSVTEDTVTIRGLRHEPEGHWGRRGTPHVQECHWGAFSRSIVLPCRIRPDEAEATLKDGVLTVSLPKTRRDNRLSIIEETD